MLNVFKTAWYRCVTRDILWYYDWYLNSYDLPKSYFIKNVQNDQENMVDDDTQNMSKIAELIAKMDTNLYLFVICVDRKYTVIIWSKKTLGCEEFLWYSLSLRKGFFYVVTLRRLMMPHRKMPFA